MSALTEFFDVVEHLVQTHSTWNLTLSKDEALAKVAAAKSEEALKFVAPVALDAIPLADAVAHGELPPLADVEKLLTDVEGGKA